MNSDDTNKPPEQPGLGADESADNASSSTSLGDDHGSGDFTPPPNWKSQLRERISRVSSRLRTGYQSRFRKQGVTSPSAGEWAKGFATKLASFEPLAAAEWANRSFQRHGSSGAGFYGKALTIGLCAWFLADLTAILLGKYVPEPPVSRLERTGGATTRRARALEEYNVIFTRNLFNSQGIIPGEEEVKDVSPTDPGGPPVKTTLPFNLIGTLILRDELRSLATIEDKSASSVYPVRVQDEIPTKARILKIESRRVTFLNMASNRREFVELPDDPNAKNPTINVGKPTAGRGGIEKVSPNQFNVSRAEVDKSLQDLNNVLTQARAVPNFENGVANGYKLFQIVPGSIYDKLGLQNGDVIAGLNGETINDPGKAFGMLSELKTSNHLELQVKKDGKLQTYIYDIR